MDIIGENPHRFETNIEHYKFETINLNIHEDTSNDNAKIEELDRIPIHIRSIKELLFEKEKLEYFVTHNTKIVIDILKNYELLEEKYIYSQP